MLKDFLNRARPKLDKIDEGCTRAHLAEAYLDLYEELQRCSYVPVEPHAFLSQAIPPARQEALVGGEQAPDTAARMLLAFFLTRSLPTPEAFADTLLAEAVIDRYGLLLSSMVFHAKSGPLTDLYLKAVLTKGHVPASGQVLDFQVLAAFFCAKSQAGLSRADKTRWLEDTCQALLCVAGDQASPGRALAYKAILNASRNMALPAIEAAVAARASGDLFCTPLQAIRNFYGPEVIVSPEAPRPVAEVQGQGACILTACDKSYFNRYFDHFCEQSDLDGLSLHLHCIDFRPPEARLARARERLGGMLTVSGESYRGYRGGDAYGTWCAAARYRMLPDLLARHETVVVTDIDGFVSSVLQDLLATVTPGFHTNLATNENAEDIRLPWNILYAGNCIFRRDAPTWRFVQALAGVCDRDLRARIQAKERVHYFDQGALASLAAASGVTPKPIPMFFEQRQASRTSFRKSRPLP